MRTDVRRDDLKLKDVILNQCNARNDVLCETVRKRVLGAGSDLHAVNARYDNKCHITFFSKHKIVKSQEPPEDQAFVFLCECMDQDRKRIWNSVDMKQMYESYGGNMRSKSLFAEVHQYIGCAVVILSSPGMANLIVFEKETGKMLHLVKSDDDDLCIAIDKVANQIHMETLACKKSHNL